MNTINLQYAHDELREMARAYDEGHGFVDAVWCDNVAGAIWVFAEENGIPLTDPYGEDD